jgi:hypothetical protein
MYKKRKKEKKKDVFHSVFNRIHSFSYLSSPFRVCGAVGDDEREHQRKEDRERDLPSVNNSVDKLSFEIPLKRKKRIPRLVRGKKKKEKKRKKKKRI